MSFSFGFANDDVNDDDDHDNDVMAATPSRQHANTTAAQHNASPIAPVEHSLAELLASLPDRISYGTLRIESPTGRELLLPRRELYDVRVQLMAEDETVNDEILKDISDSDIRTGVYEGGFKTWECSLDLASLLLDRGPRKDIDELCRCDQVIELGCGTAMPTLVLFQHALRNDIPMTFTLSDYNDSVLRLVTLPNIFLTWAAYDSEVQLDLAQEEAGDLEIDEALIDRFKQSLSRSGINLKFIAGGWSPDFAALVSHSAPDMGTLILAAETIYSEASTKAFVDITVDLLRRVKMSKAMVAAKRFYFGVGGSVDGLKEACRDQDAVAYEIENHGVPGMTAGIGRALVEIQMY